MLKHNRLSRIAVSACSVLWVLVLAAVCVLSRPEVILAEPDYSEGPGAVAEAYIVYDPDNDRVIAAKNMHDIHYPASITKIMTALLVLEQCYNLDEVITFSHAAVTNITSDSSTLVPVAKEGERMTVRDVLYGMFLSSGNECANMLAEYVAGSTEAFAVMMNDRAAQIGANDTHFVNAHGLHDDNHYTTCYDMALIFAEALKNPAFRALASTKEYVIPATNMTAARTATMGHQMVVQTPGYICDGVFAGKTGRTPQAGRTLVTASERNGITLITVVMKSEGDKHYTDTMGLINYAYDVLSGELTPTEWVEKTETVIVHGTTNGVNVRQFATTDSEIMGRVEEGQALTRVATWGNYWSRVEYQGTYYYVHSAYVVAESELPETPPVSTATPTVTAPETTPQASISVIVPPGSDQDETASSGAIGGNSSETGPGIGDSLGDPTSEMSDSEEEGSSDSGLIRSEGDSKILKTIIIVCIVLMVLILLITLLPVIFPKKRKRYRSGGRQNYDNWYQ